MFKKLLLTIVILVILANEIQSRGHRGHRGTHHHKRRHPPSIHNYPSSISGLSGSSNPLSPWNKYPLTPGLPGPSLGSKYPPSNGLSGSVINTGYPSNLGRPYPGSMYPGNAANQLNPPYPGFNGNDKPSYPPSSGLSGSRIEPSGNYSTWPNYNSQKYGYNNIPGYGPYNNYTQPFH